MVRTPLATIQDLADYYGTFKLRPAAAGQRDTSCPRDWTQTGLLRMHLAPGGWLIPRISGDKPRRTSEAPQNARARLRSFERLLSRDLLAVNERRLVARNPPVGTAPTSPVDCRSERRRSTGGVTLGSTGSRPMEDKRRCNRAPSVGLPTSGETITSSTSRRIPMATAGSEGVGFPSKSRSYRWGRRRSRSYTEGSGRKSHG